jgi:hypothetical protein
MELLPAWTKAGSWSLGRDPLGMQATSVRLYRNLVPGLTNVTNRLRYYSFYCWAIQHYEQTEHSRDEARWRVFIRRAEALYVLACNVVDSAQSDGLAGGFWAGKFIKTLPAGTIDFRINADDPELSSRYLKAKRGNFGQFYIASMTDIGLLAPSSTIPIVSNDLGRAMADAFAKSIGKTTELISNGIRTGIVTSTDLAEIGTRAHPSNIPVDSEEMELLRDYLLARKDERANGRARRSSAWLVLDLLRRGVGSGNQLGIRRAFYNRKLPSGEPYEILGQTIDEWRAFQANELCHISFDALLNGLLAELHKYPFGLAPDLLVTRLVEPLLRGLGIQGRSWREWATEIGSSFIGQEEDFADHILAAMKDEALASSADAHSSALRLIATLWYRWNGEDGSVRGLIKKHAGKEGRSLSSVLNTLDAQASNSAEQTIIKTIRHHVISDHLMIAGRKLAATGTFTYHLTMSDGVVSDGRIAVYTYTNPRLQNLIRFLRDANFHDGRAVTPNGTSFLNASQPV